MPSKSTRIRWNCGRCGYLALSSPHEDTDKGTETHKCPMCGEQWWLDQDTFARMSGEVSDEA